MKVLLERKVIVQFPRRAELRNLVRRIAALVTTNRDGINKDRSIEVLVGCIGLVDLSHVDMIGIPNDSKRLPIWIQVFPNGYLPPAAATEAGISAWPVTTVPKASPSTRNFGSSWFSRRSSLA